MQYDVYMKRHKADRTYQISLRVSIMFITQAFKINICPKYLKYILPLIFGLPRMTQEHLDTMER